LLAIGDGKPILDRDDAVFDENPLHEGHLEKKSPILVGRAVAKDVFHSSTVVRGSAHQNNLASVGKVSKIALKIPLALFTFAGHLQRDDVG